MKSYNPCSFESGAPLWVHYCLACAGKFPEAMAFCWYSASKCGLWELAWRPFCFLTIEENSKIFPFRPLTTRLSLIKCIAASLSQSLTPFLLFPWSWPLFYRLSSIIKANLFRHTNERRSQEYICCRSPASLPNQVDIRFSVSHTDKRYKWVKLAQAKKLERSQCAYPQDD